VLRSQHFVFPAPSVIRLIEYIDVRGRQGRSSTKRSRILSRDRYRCQYWRNEGGPFDRRSTTSCRVRGAAKQLRGTCALPASLAISARATARPKKHGCSVGKSSRADYGMERAEMRHAAESRAEWRSTCSWKTPALLWRNNGPGSAVIPACMASHKKRQAGMPALPRSILSMDSACIEV